MAQLPSFAKLINHGEESRKKILVGVTILADLVTSTLGPGGRFVCIHRPMDIPFLTKDGVTVAKEVFLHDEFEDAGAQMVKDVASKTCDQAGDGTTTATLLAHAMYEQGLAAITAGANPVVLKRGMDLAVTQAIAALKASAEQVGDDDVKKVATISANGDEFMAGLVAAAVTKAGRDGVVVIDESHSLETKIQVVDGCRLNTGWVSPRFITNEKLAESQLENPYILIIDKKLQSISELISEKGLFEQISDQSRPLLLICEDLQGEALATLVFNKVRGTLQSCAIRTPGYKEMGRELLEDIAALTGATVISDDLGMKLSSIGFEHLGQADSVKVSMVSTSILGGKSDPNRLADRVEEIRQAILRESDQSQMERLRERMARISGGIVVIKIGGATALEVEEKKYRAEDAMHATQSALEEGIVTGGGVALLRAAQSLVCESEVPDFSTGFEIVRDSMARPLQKIVSNAGFDSRETLSRVEAEEGSFGFNALTGEYGDLKEQGVIDPVKVVISALRNAESIASVMLVTEGMIVHPINNPANGK